MPKSIPRQTIRQPKADDEDQSKLFIEKARKIEADEDRSAADELLRRMAETAPKSRKRP